MTVTLGCYADARLGRGVHAARPVPRVLLLALAPRHAVRAEPALLARRAVPARAVGLPDAGHGRPGRLAHAFSPFPYGSNDRITIPELVLYVKALIFPCGSCIVRIHRGRVAQSVRARH